MIWHIQFEWGQHTRSFNFWGKQCVQNSYFSLSIYKISCHLHLWWKQFDTVKSALCIKSSWINCTKKSQRIRRRCARLQSGYGQQHQSGTLCFLSSLGKNIQSRGPGQSLFASLKLARFRGIQRDWKKLIIKRWLTTIYITKSLSLSSMCTL